MIDTQDLQRRIRARRSVLDGLSGEARSVIFQAENLETEIESLKLDILHLEQASGILNSVGEDRQLKAQGVIEELVTRGLQSIFNSNYSFHILQTVKNKNAHVEFMIRTTVGGSVIETPVMESRGGGMAAIVGFILRVVVMLLRKDVARILFLDETFAHVSAEYLPALGEFLREVVDKSGIQIVMVTHQDEFVEYADKVVRFELDKNEKTRVKVQHDK